MTLALWGVGIGIGGALVVSRLMRSLLFGVGVVDAVTFVTVPTLLACHCFFRQLYSGATRFPHRSQRIVAMRIRSDANGEVDFGISDSSSRDALNPLASLGGRLEGIGEILCLMHDLSVTELHDAHGVCRSPLVDDGVLRNPEIAFSEHSFDFET